MGEVNQIVCIYLQATGYATKPNVQRVGLLLINHIGDSGIEMYTIFNFYHGDDLILLNILRPLFCVLTLG